MKTKLQIFTRVAERERAEKTKEKNSLCSQSSVLRKLKKENVIDKKKKKNEL
jgi:hypothetical protein